MNGCRRVSLSSVRNAGAGGGTVAMSKEEQRLAAKRILAKEPLTPEEQLLYEILTKTPEMYVAPDPETGERICGVCGEVFPNLETFADHQVDHNPTSAEWSVAYQRMRDARETKKSESAG